MLRNVQILRAVAALLVVIGHLQPLFERVDPGLWIVSLGRAGVDLFFVISGFVMVYTTNRADPSAGQFAYRRITRIVPLYWLLTFAVFALALIAPSVLGASRPDSVWLLKSLAFVPFAKGDGTMNPLLPVGWTLNYEMAFYAVFALSMLAGRRWRYWIAGGLMLVAALPGFLRLPISNPVFDWYTHPIIAEFVAGMVLGALFPRISGVSRVPTAAVAAAFCGLFAVLLGSGLMESEPLRVTIAAASATAIVALAIALERGGRAASSRLALLVGDASYSIYLTHLFVTQIVIAVAVRLAVSGALAAGASVVALTLVTICGILSYKLFELPVTRVLKTFPAKPLAVAAE